MAFDPEPLDFPSRYPKPARASTPPKAPAYSPQLKEIAGRLQKLAYRDMVSWGTMISDELQTKETTAQAVVEALLLAASHINNEGND